MIFIHVGQHNKDTGPNFLRKLILEISMITKQDDMDGLVIRNMRRIFKSSSDIQGRIGPSLENLWWKPRMEKRFSSSLLINSSIFFLVYDLDLNNLQLPL